MGIHGCHSNAVCINIQGGRNCTCNSGFTGNGITCTDIDECAAMTDNCDANATCTNTVGSFECACNPGYIGNGTTCTDIDECDISNPTHNCDSNAQCTNTNGGFTCTCNPGYTGNGTTCTDIDECSTSSDDCHPNATCGNTNGTFTCTCNSGYVGNGQFCQVTPSSQETQLSVSISGNFTLDLLNSSSSSYIALSNLVQEQFLIKIGTNESLTINSVRFIQGSIIAILDLLLQNSQQSIDDVINMFDDRRGSQSLFLSLPSKVSIGVVQNVQFSLSSHEVFLSFEPPLIGNGFIHYQVVYYLPNGQNITMEPSTNLSSTIVDLMPFTQYKIQIIAMNLEMAGISYTEYVTTLESEPGPVNNLAVDDVASDSTLLSWEAPTITNGVIIEYIVTWLPEENSSNRQNEVTASTNNLFYTVQSLSPFTSYIVSVNAVTSAGVGVAVSVSLTTLEDVPREIVQNVQLDVSTTEIRITFEPPTTRTGLFEYRIVLSIRDALESTQFIIQTSNTEVVFGDLQPYSLYNLEVVASTVAGPGPSYTANVRTLEGIASPVQHLVAGVVTTDTITIMWIEPSTPNGLLIYQVSRLPGGISINTTNTGVTIGSLVNNTEYSLSVTPFTGAGPGQLQSIAVTTLNIVISCNSITCGPNAYCVESTDNEQDATCLCNQFFTGDPFVLCASFCSGKVIPVGSESESYTFEDTWSDQIALSVERCPDEERSIASILCTGTGFDFSLISVVLCDETITSVVSQTNEILQENITSEMVDTFSATLQLVSSNMEILEDERTMLNDAITDVLNATTGMQITAYAWLNLMEVADTITVNLENENQFDEAIIEEKEQLLQNIEQFGTVVEIPADSLSVAIETSSLVGNIYRIPESPNLARINDSTSNQILFNQNITSSSENITSIAIVANVQIPEEVFEASQQGRSGQIAVLYHKSRTLFSSDLNASQIVTVTVGNDSLVTGLRNPIRISHFGETVNFGEEGIPENDFQSIRTELSCQFWDFDLVAWSGEGCCLNETQFPPLCQCNHLTNFALIVTRTEVPADIALAVVSKIACILSVIGLFLTFIIQITYKKKRNLESTKILLHICFNLMIFNILFLTGVEAVKIRRNCIAVTALLQYFVLTTWFWMAAYTYNIYLNLIVVFRTTRIMRKAYMICYGVPLVITVLNVGIAVGYVDQQQASTVTCSGEVIFRSSSYVTDNYCWLTDYSLYFGFLLPVGILLLANLVVFVLVMRKAVWRRKKIGASIRSTATTTAKRNASVSANLFITMGISWVLGYIMLISSNQTFLTVMSWLFAFFSASQGLSIFFLVCVNQKDVRDKVTADILTFCGRLRTGTLCMDQSQYDIPSTSGCRSTVSTVPRTAISLPVSSKSEVATGKSFVSI